ncbi:sigma 54-interacting transcriptional regulator, partial [bacterium]|nr:sigma 54-interacting transcriptional regulator [bacterium]
MIGLIRDISKRKKAERALQKTNEELEQRVAKRTAELSQANASLEEAFAEVEELKNRLQVENVYLQKEIKLEHNFDEIITNSPRLKNLLNKVEQVAKTEATVLILGETGTGKELIARAVHCVSPRKNRPLVKINCAALPANLIESELFGHERGAFTGALTRKQGRFEIADLGTLFLDEIGDLPVELQAKLLRVLQDGEFERLGSTQTQRVDVRILAATNRNLNKAVEAGHFREDLFFRLNVFPLSL